MMELASTKTVVNKQKGTVVLACNCSTQEAKAGGSEFKTSLGYIANKTWASLGHVK